jgi:hypothetical protein
MRAAIPLPAKGAHCESRFHKSERLSPFFQGSIAPILDTTVVASTLAAPSLNDAAVWPFVISVGMNRPERTSEIGPPQRLLAPKLR